MITTSIDAGHVETFKKVRGVKVFEKVVSKILKLTLMHAKRQKT